MKSPTLRGALLFLVLSIACGIYALTRPREWRFAAGVMGTRLHVTLVGTPLMRMRGALAGAFRSALAEIEEIEGLMSIYREESDVNRLNAAEADMDVRVAPRTFEVLREAVELHALTGGAFDVSVLPYERAWGFKGEGERHVPRMAERDSSAGLLGEMKFTAVFRRFYVALPSSGMHIDLGGIAKGYAIDLAAAVLRSEGVRGALIEIGGDCFCLGRNAAGEPWRVGARNPRKANVLATIELEDCAVATSGDYEDFFSEDGERFSHIFDPRTGRPAASGVISATVIAPRCTRADALATALMVMGKKEGLALVEELDQTECLLVEEKEGQLLLSRSSGFDTFSPDGR